MQRNETMSRVPNKMIFYKGVNVIFDIIEISHTSKIYGLNKL